MTTFEKNQILFVTKLVIMKNSLFFFCILMLASCVNPEQNLNENSDFKSTEEYYNKLINTKPLNVAAIKQFLVLMPKGGDIHHHYSGTIYAETYLEWVKSQGWYINIKTFKVEKDKNDNNITVDKLSESGALYTKTLELWSDKDYYNHYSVQTSPDQKFFSTFGYFGSISSVKMMEGLKIIKSRAINENISYIETMLSKVGITANTDYLENQNKINQYNTSLIAATTQEEVNDILEQIDKIYFESELFNSNIIDYITKLETIHKEIDDDNFTMRYQTYASRMSAPLQVYTDLLSAYITATKSEFIVGVNIVAAENNIVSLRDYELHMMFFNYLNSKYKNVHKSLHAGELTLGMVRPKNLLFHINQAVFVAGADRIGHGVDIPYEIKSYDLLDSMKEKNIAVEINLTSNEFILGVKGNDHPYLIYTKHNVPIVISTDDSGVSRNTLSGEFTLLVTRYKPSYTDIKKYVYNSIEYSFLDADNKNKLHKTLDDKFSNFEEQISAHNTL